jgi:hypothetical protein
LCCIDNHCLTTFYFCSTYSIRASNSGKPGDLVFVKSSFGAYLMNKSIGIQQLNDPSYYAYVGSIDANKHADRLMDFTIRERIVFYYWTCRLYIEILV